MTKILTPQQILKLVKPTDNVSQYAFAIVIKEQNAEGKAHGLHRVYSRLMTKQHLNGDNQYWGLTYIAQYNNGVINGRELSFEFIGLKRVLKSYCRVKNNVMHGTSYHCRNGSLYAIKSFKNGKKHGRYAEVSELHTVNCEYDEGKLIGYCFKRFEDYEMRFALDDNSEIKFFRDNRGNWYDKEVFDIPCPFEAYIDKEYEFEDDLVTWEF